MTLDSVREIFRLANSQRLKRTAAFQMEAKTATRNLIIKCDDIGMCPEVNIALTRVVCRKMPLSASLMTVSPHFMQSVRVLREHPEVSLGIHLALNSEWKNYRWKPVSKRALVPTLVDSSGNFYPTRAALFAAEPKLSHISVELRGQIERAFTSGLRFDYLDYHMFSAVSTQPLQELVEALGSEYRLRLSPFRLQSQAIEFYMAHPDKKLEVLLRALNRITEDEDLLLVFHIGQSGRVLESLVDVNAFNHYPVATSREAELNALLSDEFSIAVRKCSIRLINCKNSTIWVCPPG